MLRITASKLLATCIWILAVVRVALTVSLAATAWSNGTVAVVHTGTFKWQASSINAIAAFTDICIALALCIGLLRRRTGFVQSDKLIDRLVAFTIGEDP